MSVYYRKSRRIAESPLTQYCSLNPRKKGTDHTKHKRHKKSIPFSCLLCFLCSVIDNGPQETRTIVQVTGGRFEGPRLKATVQTPAGDWITNRPDGTYRLDVRMTLKTQDGAVILVTYNGIGQTTNAGASLRIAPLFETGDPRYAWLTRLQAVGVGERVGTTVTYDIFALK